MPVREHLIRSYGFGVTPHSPALVCPGSLGPRPAAASAVREKPERAGCLVTRAKQKKTTTTILVLRIGRRQISNGALKRKEARRGWPLSFELIAPTEAIWGGRGSCTHQYGLGGQLHPVNPGPTTTRHDCWCRRHSKQSIGFPPQRRVARLHDEAFSWGHVTASSINSRKELVLRGRVSLNLPR